MTIRQLSLWAIFLLTALGCQNLIFGQTTDADFSKVISRQQAYQDIDSLTKWIEEIHPNMFEHITKSDFDIKVDDTKQRIQQNITVREFYNLIAPLFTSLKDAHTELQSPFVVKERRNDLFPILICLTNNQKDIVLENSIDNNASLKQIPNGSKSERMIAELGEQISYETKALFNARFRDLFSALLYCRYGFKVNFEVEYIYNNKIEKITLTNQSFFIKSNTLNKYEYSFSIEKNRNYALLTINSFGVKNENEYFLFLRKLFAKLKCENINTLIIDIRNNDGGNST